MTRISLASSAFLAAALMVGCASPPDAGKESLAGVALQIATISLPGGQLQAFYSSTLAASGGTAPYTWSIVSGALPAGLTLNASTGVIVGTPTTAGTTSFTVQAKDSSSTAQTAQQALSIAVNAASSSGAGIIVVPTGADPLVNGTNLSTAMTNAQCGSTIVLQAGAKYQATHFGSFRFHPMGACSGTDADYITICPGNTSGCVQTGLPAPGARINPPVNIAAMATVVADDTPAFVAQANAHHWKLLGLEITDAAIVRGGTTTFTPALVDIDGNQQSSGTDYSVMINTNHFIIDRCFIHPSNISASQLTFPWGEVSAGEGIVGYTPNLTIVGSWIGGFGGLQPGTSSRAQTYGILISTGPVLIQNNYVEAYFNNIFITGSLVNPANTAVVTGGTLTGATFSSTSNLNVGDIVAIQVDGSFCPARPTSPCFETATIDTVNPSTGAVTYHAIGPDIGTAGNHCALKDTPMANGIAQWNGDQPHDVTVKQNTLYKQPNWQVDSPGGAKDTIEIKQCINCLVDGNTYAGACSNFVTPEVKGSLPNNAGPWATVHDLTVSNNLISNTAPGWIPLGDYEQTATPGYNVFFLNNLVLNMPLQCPPGQNEAQMIFTERGRSLADGGTNITYSHNTFRWAGASQAYFIKGNGSSNTIDNNGQSTVPSNFTFKDSILDFGYYGIGNVTSGPVDFPPNGVVDLKNVINTRWPIQPGRSPTGPGEFPHSFVVSGDSGIGFVNITACDSGVDYHGCALTSGSTYHNAASDGKDPGVDFAALDSALGPLANTVVPLISQAESASPILVVNLRSIPERLFRLIGRLGAGSRHPCQLNWMR